MQVTREQDEARKVRELTFPGGRIRREKIVRARPRRLRGLSVYHRNICSMVLFYGLAGRLTTQNGGFQRGQKKIGKPTAVERLKHEVRTAVLTTEFTTGEVSSQS